MLAEGERFRPWLEARLSPLTPGAVFWGREIDGETRGVVAFDHYSGDDVELIYAGEPGWITPRLLRAVFAYVFEIMGCTRCTGRVTADDTYALSLAQRMGFKIEGRLRRACKGLDVIVVGMLKEECQYGQKGQRIGQEHPADQPAANGGGICADEPARHLHPVRVAAVRDRP